MRYFIPPPIPTARTSEAIKTQIVERYRTGELVKVLADEYGISDAMVCKVANNRGLRRHRKPPLRNNIPTGARGKKIN